MGWHSIPRKLYIRLSLHCQRGSERKTAAESWQNRRPRLHLRNCPSINFLSASNWKSLYRAIRAAEHHRPSNSLLVCVTDRGASSFWSKRSLVTNRPGDLVRVVRQKVTINLSIQILLGCAITRPLMAVDMSDLVRISHGRIGYIEKADATFINGPAVTAFDTLWAYLRCDMKEIAIQDIELIIERLSDVRQKSDSHFCVAEGYGAKGAFYCKFVPTS